MSYDVVVQRAAWRDVDECFSYLEKHSFQGAADWYSEFLKWAAELAVDPAQHPIVTSLRPRDPSIRFKTFQTRHGRPYHLVLMIDESMSQVRVLRVRSPGQRSVRKRDLE